LRWDNRPADRVSAGEVLPAALDRVLTVALVLALAAVAIQTPIHLMNAAVDGSREFDANAESNAMAWASSVATFGAAFAAALHAVLVRDRRGRYVFLACLFAFFSLDDSIVVHEGLSWEFAQFLGLPTWWDSVLWPMLYLPLAGAAVLLLAAAARTAPARARRFIRVGLVLLLTAVAAEALSAPLPTSHTQTEWGHVLEGAYEEGAELVGWILIAAGLTVCTLYEAGPTLRRA
jgi:hypothetical protein